MISKRMATMLGYKRGSFVGGLLHELGIDRSKMRAYYPKEFAEALDKGSANGGVAAIVREILIINSYKLVGIAVK